MPRKGPNLRIRVKDEGTKGGKRRIVAEVVGESKLFESSDTFAERGTIRTLSDMVKEAVTKEVRVYFAKGEEMMELVDKVLREHEQSEAPKTKEAA